MAKATLYTKEMSDRYTREGYWTHKTLSDFWDENAHTFPAKEAIVDSSHRLTWAQAKIWIDRLALGLLELGLKKDEVVVIQLPNCVELYLLRVACERAGLLHLPVLRTLRHTEMTHILGYTGARAIVIPWKYRDFDYLDMAHELKPNLSHLKHILIWGDEAPRGATLLKNILNISLEKKYPAEYLESKKMPAVEFSLIGNTTGTTGLPKFVEIPICSLVVTGLGIPRFKLRSDDRIMSTTTAVAGPNVPPFTMGVQIACKIVVLEYWTVENALSLMQKEKVTILSVVPTQLAEIIAYPDLEKYDLTSLRAIRSTGAPLPYQLALEVEEKLKCPILNSYGAVDFGGISASAIDEPVEVRHLTAGRPMQGNEIQLRDTMGKEVASGEIGEIFVRGPYGVSGYFKDPESTAKLWTKDGWYRTGDLGKFDDKGNLIIAGREKDMIIRGGQNIYPLEVENLLMAHPKVSAVAIVGIPDSMMGERACACVVPKNNQDFSFEEMISYLKTKRIAAYKLPEKLLLFDFLPRVGELKLDKKVIRAQAIERLKTKK